MKACSQLRPVVRIAFALLAISPLLSSCGGSVLPGDTKTAPVSQATTTQKSEFREYALLMSTGDFRNPARIFASRVPGRPVDQMIEINRAGMGRYATVGLSCPQNEVSRGPARLIENGLRTGKKTETPWADLDVVGNVACTADWKGAVRTNESNLAKGLAGASYRRTPRPRGAPGAGAGQ